MDWFKVSVIALFVVCSGCSEKTDVKTSDPRQSMPVSRQVADKPAPTPKKDALTETGIPRVAFEEFLAKVPVESEQFRSSLETLYYVEKLINKSSAARERERARLALGLEEGDSLEKNSQLLHLFVLTRDGEKQPANPEFIASFLECLVFGTIEDAPSSSTLANAVQGCYTAAARDIGLGDKKIDGISFLKLLKP